jgi:hypothetical protein
VSRRTRYSDVRLRLWNKRLISIFKIGDREKLIAHVEKLQGLIDKMRVDKDAAVREYDLLTIKSKQMKMDYDELREVFI